MTESTMELVEKIIIWVGLLGVYAIVIITGVKGYIAGKRLKDKTATQEFYFGKKGSKNLLIREQKDVAVADILLWGLLMLLYVVPICYLLASPAVGLRDVWSGTGEYVDNLPNVMFAGISVTTIVTAVTGLSSKTWIGFGINDILNEFAVIRKIKITFLLTSVCLLMIYSAPVLLNVVGYQLYFAFRMVAVLGFLLYLYLLIKVVWIIFGILFGKYIEKFCADNLYRLFWYKNDNWKIRKRETDSIKRITEYLVWKYKKATEKINFSELESITYDTNIRKGEDRYNERMWKATGLIAFVITIMVVFILVASTTFDDWKLWSAVVCGFIILVILGVTNEGVTRLFVQIRYGLVAYRLNYKGNKYKQISDGTLLEYKKSFKYVRSAENILALYKVAIKNQENEIPMIIIDCLMQEMQAIKEQEGKDKIKALLVAMEYVLFCEKEEIINNLRYKSKDKCVLLAKGFAIKVTNSIDGDHVDLSRYNKYVSEKQKMLEQLNS